MILSGPTIRTHSRVLFYGHFVWTTRNREPTITSDLERALHRAIGGIANGLRCQVLAIGGMPDHVHLVLRLPGSLSPAEAMKRIKGQLSALANDLRPDSHGAFRWAEGYGFFSIGQSKTELAAIVAYVQNQKQHHAANTLARRL